jgi:hypothetical protein
MTVISGLTSFADPHHFTNEWLTALRPLHEISKAGMMQFNLVCLASCHEVYSNTTTYIIKSHSGNFKKSYNPAPMALRSIYTCIYIYILFIINIYVVICLTGILINVNKIKSVVLRRTHTDISFMHEVMTDNINSMASHHSSSCNYYIDFTTKL